MSGKKRLNAIRNISQTMVERGLEPVVAEGEGAEKLSNKKLIANKIVYVNELKKRIEKLRTRKSKLKTEIPSAKERAKKIQSEIKVLKKKLADARQATPDTSMAD